MLRDPRMDPLDPLLTSAGADPLALYINTKAQASDDRLPCLKTPRPEGAESSLTESASSPFQAEPAHGTLWPSRTSRARRTWRSDTLSVGVKTTTALH